ncbi:CBL-interacting serine/threonine-protein kinase 8-like isoform X8 [Durio zibethinus]|uniref:CBL-interacting serine/threonine-protein kinase 8-like isoform X8 n=1 Tax=Durio zibethinus TaxID=66656 RepID=A0A6P6AUP6_DURZI|nr:CBL-interacting serine/threonine-protein kinase 8-like isoform X8 [Durio zibethinus]
MVVRKVGKYEIGRTIGEGTFAKVKFAQNTETGESVAMKVLDRSTIIKHKMVDQIKREISIMKLVRHPYVVRLHEVIASRTKIYIILEFITGGELFDKIADGKLVIMQIHNGRLSEAEARRYFQQLIDGVEYCHSKGVYHRDLKPENLLLDSLGNLKISDFGLSALPEQGVSLLRTTCGTPNYVAPEVLSHKGYDGAVADVWSCGVILYVLMAGYLPFDELDLTTLYSKIERAEFSCPSWFPVGAKSLIHRILDPNPQTDSMKYQTRFVSQKPARVVLSSMEVVAQSMGYKTHIRNYKMRVEGLSANKASHFSVILEVFEVAPTFLMVDIQKAAGDAGDFLKRLACSIGQMQQPTFRYVERWRRTPFPRHQVSQNFQVIHIQEDCSLY